MNSQQVSLVTSDVEHLQGCAQVLKHMFAYAESLALKSAVELRIADIIHANGKPMSLSNLASQINPPHANVTFLARVMLLLVRSNFFTLTNNNDQSSGETNLYGLTPASKWLIHDQELSLAPIYLFITHPLLVSSWHEFSGSIKNGGTPFERAHGQAFWEMASVDPIFNNIFNSAMASTSGIKLNVVLTWYKQGFNEIQGTLVDVGGGTGRAISEIVKAHPHIQGVNFDLPHVVATAPKYSGVTHIAGDMFKDIPNADAIFISSVLHDWGDDDCIKILHNCKKAISAKKGKVIIIEMVLNPEKDGLFDHHKVYSDLLMVAIFDGGKERTKDEWNKLLKGAGFVRYNIITIPHTVSIIEAYTN